jgi:hypothetical protein
MFAPQVEALFARLARMETGVGDEDDSQKADQTPNPRRRSMAALQPVSTGGASKSNRILIDLNLEQTAALFRERGGKAVLMGKNPPRNINERFQLHDMDVVFPICHSGVNRSQTLWHMLKQYGVETIKPHGAIDSMDPFPSVGDNRIYICSPKGEKDKLDEAFKEAFGTYKSPVAFYDRQVCDAMNRAARVQDFNYKVWESSVHSQQRNSFTSTYWSKAYWGDKKKSNHRLVYIAFKKAPLIALRRLMESNRDCTGIVVVSLPLDDPMNNPDVEGTYAQKYGQMWINYMAYIAPPVRQRR